MIYKFHHYSQDWISGVAPQAKIKPDDTRARIIEAAEALFRRLGFAKTAVADIANELGMSPANIYRFFPSKHAIIDEICQRCLAELDEKAWAVARSPGAAGARIEQLILAILAYHKENLLNEQRVYDMVLVAIEHNWTAIRAHKDVIRTVYEVLLRQGMEAGEFETLDLRATSQVLMRSLVGLCHPLLVAEALRDGDDLEAEARASVQFLLRAIARRS